MCFFIPKYVSFWSFSQSNDLIRFISFICFSLLSESVILTFVLVFTHTGVLLCPIHLTGHARTCGCHRIGQRVSWWMLFWASAVLAGLDQAMSAKRPLDDSQPLLPTNSQIMDQRGNGAEELWNKGESWRWWWIWGIKERRFLKKVLKLNK